MRYGERVNTASNLMMEMTRYSQLPVPWRNMVYDLSSRGSNEVKGVGDKEQREDLDPPAE